MDPHVIEEYFIHPLPFSPMVLSMVLAALLLVLAFEVWMLVDVLAYRKVPPVHRMWWVLLMFLIHPFVAIVYFFVRTSYKKVR